MNAARKTLVLGFFLTTLFSVNDARAQSQLHMFPGDSPGETHGSSVAGIGDIDGDGHGDLIVGAPGAANGGRARVYSGQTGAILFEHFGQNPDDTFGTAVGGIGDVDGDGVPDYAVGAPGHNTIVIRAGSLYVYSGASGGLIYQMVGETALEKLGNSFSMLNDLDGDGVDDFVVASPEHSVVGQYAGAVHVVSGATGVRMYTLLGAAAHAGFGRSVAGLGDLDGDGFSEFAVGAWSGVGLAYVYSGATGTLHEVLVGPAWNSWFGYSTANVGDVNGDGYTDLLVGAPKDDTLFNESGSAWLYSGSDFSLLWSMYGQRAGIRFGSQVAGLGDLDGDGYGDFAVTAAEDYPLLPTSFPEGVARVYSGFTGNQMAAFWGNGVNAQLFAVESAGDVNSDGHRDIILGSYAMSSYAGAAWVVSGEPCSQVDSFCVTSPNSVGAGALMSYESKPSLSQNDLVLTCDGVPANTMGVFFYSKYQRVFTFGNGIRCLNSPIARLGIVQAQGSKFSYGLDVTQPPSLDGQIGPWTPWYFQCWYRDPQAGPAHFNVSDGLRVVFCE